MQQNNMMRLPFQMTCKKDNKYNNQNNSNINYNYINYEENENNMNYQNNINNVNNENNENKQNNNFNSNYKYDKKEFLEEFMKLHNDIYFNPYKILSISKDYNSKSLKKMYKKLALIYHPDKPTGDEKIFKEITQAYLYLLKKFKEKIPDKQIIELKNEYNNFVQEQEDELVYNNKKFDINAFNKMFNDNNQQNNDGYNDFMKNNKQEEEENNSYIFSTNFNLELFNKMFEKDNINSSQIVEYKDPHELTTYSNNYQKLGEDKISDYTSDFNFQKKQLNYTDCKKAYTKSNFDPKQIKYDMFNNINELESHRSQLTYNMDEETQKNYLKKQEKDKYEEEQRLNRIEKEDLKILKQYKKLNIKMLNDKTFFNN